MKTKNKFLGLLGGLLFITIIAVNLNISQNYEVNERFAQLTLTELSAIAQSGGGECFYYDGGPVISCSSTGSGCCYYNTTYCTCTWTGSPSDYCSLCWT